MKTNVSNSALKKLSKNQETWPRLEVLVNQTMNNESTKAKLLAITGRITGSFLSLEDTLNEICSRSCVNCEEPCCTKATVYYDLRDLLFIYLKTGTLPVDQISRNSNKDCTLLTQSGCQRNRMDRPFICTWYICSRQKIVLADMPNSPFTKDVLKVIKNIQSDRKELESLFLNALDVA